MQSSQPSIDQTRVNLLLYTIERNLLTDCQIDFTQQNKRNVLKLYQSVYQYEIQNQREKIYAQMKQKIKDKTELDILDWFQTYRAVKYSGDVLPGARLHEMSHKIALCQNPDSLKSSRFVCYGFEIAVRYDSSLERVQVGKSVFEIKRHSKFKKEYLFRQKMDRDEMSTPWIVEKTIDKRYIWRGDVSIDKEDVQNLLRFILFRRSPTDQCPSIVINAGSHGGNVGQNANDTGSFEYTDVNIKQQTVDTISNLLAQAQTMKLTEQNVHKKIYVRGLSSVDPCIYPFTADHVIDVQCRGAFSKIPAESLYPKGFPYVKKDLIFRYQENIYRMSEILEQNTEGEEGYVALSIKELLGKSSIIKTKQHAEALLTFLARLEFKSKGLFSLQPYLKTVSDVSLLFKASEHNFDIKKYFSICGDVQNTVIISLTNKDKIIGGYTPFCHKFKTGFWTWLKGYGEWVKDSGKSSFIFSVSAGDKFVLRDVERAIFRYKDYSRIVFGLDEFAICDHSNEIEDCWMNVNLSYQNPKYVQSNPTNYDKEMCLRLNGNPRPSFTTKEWQVWKVVFGE